MRALIFVAAIVLILALIGWITIGFGPDRSSINLETGKIRQDTQEVLQSGAEAMREAGDAAADDDEQPVAQTDN